MDVRNTEKTRAGISGGGRRKVPRALVCDEQCRELLPKSGSESDHAFELGRARQVRLPARIDAPGNLIEISANGTELRDRRPERQVLGLGERCDTAEVRAHKE